MILALQVENLFANQGLYVGKMTLLRSSIAIYDYIVLNLMITKLFFIFLGVRACVQSWNKKVRNVVV